MAIRIRKDGRLLCANHHPPQEGDIYIDDSIHEYLGNCLNISVNKITYNPITHEWFWI